MLADQYYIHKNNTYVGIPLSPGETFRPLDPKISCVPETRY